MFPIPWQQFGKPALWDVGDAAEHVGEPSQRIDVIELGRLCRRPNYAEQFWEYPVIPAHLRAVNLPSSRCHSA